MNYKKKKGFTLIELLAVITILGIIATIVLVTINIQTKTANEKLDKATEQNIYDAAIAYATEYRNTENWEEELNSNGNVEFCISLDSLIQYGYFDNEKSNYEKFKENYAVEVIINNGVYQYNFVDLTQIKEGTICHHYKTESSIKNEKGEETTTLKVQTEIKDKINTENKIGSSSYEIDKITENKYSVALNLDINLYDKFKKDETEVYVSMMLDTSGSMKGIKYTEAKNAVKDLSKSLDENIKNSHISLITYSSLPKLISDYTTKDLTEIINQEMPTVNGDTNTPGALDLATSLIYNNKIPANTAKYAILLYDGEPNSYSAIFTCNEENIDNTKYKNEEGTKECRSDNFSSIISPYKVAKVTRTETGKIESKTIDNFELYKKEYYQNFKELSQNVAIETIDGKTYTRGKTQKCPSGISYDYCRNSYYYLKYNYSNVLYENENDKNILDFVQASSKYLKETNTTLLVVGYETETKKIQNAYKEISSYDEILCSESNHTNNNQNYCYYDASVNTLSDLFLDIIEKITILNTNANDATLKLIPKTKNGSTLITLYKQNKPVESNQISQVIDLTKDNGTGKFNIRENYQFELNDEIFNICDEETCTISEKLFDVVVELNYGNNITETVNIGSPTLNMILAKTSTVN